MLGKGLETLYQLGVNKVVIACVTMHYFLPRLPTHLRQRVISLVDLIIDEVSMTDERYLLLCTSGWQLIGLQVVLPNDDDQHFIQDLIHQKIKTNPSDDSLLQCFDALSRKYQIHSFIAGTEIHLLVKRLMKHGSDTPKYRFVDLLLTLAKDLKRFVNQS